MYNQNIIRDIERIKQIQIVPTMLDVICKSTGMGFAAIARVTEESWVACSVRDEISFGLQPGGELILETTICNEIRSKRESVVIDHVEKSDVYRNHHTPNLYGFQSYISVPIILKNGEFFGTLCAIDPRPALLENAKTLGMFNLFADLIVFHLDSIIKLEESNVALKALDKQLTETQDENRQYRFISNHNLQEPLRKLRVFSNIISKASESNDLPKVKLFADKLNLNAQQFSMMIKDLSEFSNLDQMEETLEQVDLNKVVGDVIIQVDQQLKFNEAKIEVGHLPVINGIILQMEQLFYHLITNALKFARPGVPPDIKISANETGVSSISYPPSLEDAANYFEIRISDNGIGVDASQREKIFDIFSKLDYNQEIKGGGIGLSYCRKIVRNHGGKITAESEEGLGTTFIVYLPGNRPAAKVAN
jgi:signal transduction histidine kinase